MCECMCEFNIFIDEHNNRKEKQKKKRENDTNNMNREKRENTRIYILNIYIRNSSHRDYRSRRHGTMSEQEERKKKERGK